MAHNQLSELRKWLRKSGAVKVRMRKGDDDAETIAVNAKLSEGQRWAKCEGSCLAWGAEKVEALNASGDILDIFSLKEDDDEPKETGKASGGIAHDYKGLANIIDRIAARHNEAFAAGAESASGTVEALTTIVDTLTNHLALAITNIHNLSVNLAQAMAGQEQQEPAQANPMLERVLVAAASSMGAGMTTPPQQRPNGAKP